MDTGATVHPRRCAERKPFVWYEVPLLAAQSRLDGAARQTARQNMQVYASEFAA